MQLRTKDTLHLYLWLSRNVIRTNLFLALLHNVLLQVSEFTPKIPFRIQYISIATMQKASTSLNNIILYLDSIFKVQ